MSNAVARLLVVLAAVLLVACGRVEPPEKSGELVIGMIAGPTTYQSENGKISGFEYDLLESFAASLRLRTRHVVVKDRDVLFKVLREGKIHLAAGAPIDDEPQRLFTLPTRGARQVLIGNEDTLPLDADPAGLAGGDIEVLPGAPQATVLRKLAGTPPRFSVTELANGSEHDLLQRLADGKSRMAASDMLNYSLVLGEFPNLVIMRELPDQVDYGWAFSPEQTSLRQQANDFIAAMRQDGSLSRLHDRYFGHVRRLKGEGIARFIDDIHTVLPHYRQQFQAAQVSSGIDWRLIAALAYQESKWDPLATSFTNVRGMMMLTEDTADRMGVNNRLDAGQSIRAGARYLAALLEELPEEIEEPDRTWLALAAYNLGMGHLNGARTFAKQMKRDSTSWYDMKQVLPLMSRPEYYSRLKSGPARGGEAVILVESIRNYYDILCRLEAAWQPTPKLADNGASAKVPPRQPGVRASWR